MKCPRCTHENRIGAKFCEECAAPLARNCLKCTAPLPESAKFCAECGHPAPAAAAGAELKLAQLRSSLDYTPKHLADRILTSKSAMEGERKQVTVLFLDVVGFTQLAERLGPEAVHDIMDRLIRLMVEAVHRYEGTVNQFLGDGLMALFGAPLALEDHAVRAVQAALAILETVKGYSAQLKREQGVDIELRLGLNSGPVVVGSIGDDLRMDYTAVGDTTNLAARMQARAEPGTILITEATRRLVEGYVHAHSLGTVQVRGRTEPVEIFRVTYRRRRRSRLEVKAESGLTELVGREREHGLLLQALSRIKAGRGQVVGIAGEPGAGKSRLVYEFRNSVKSERITWLEGHCLPYGQTTPMLPIIEMLGINFNVEEGDNFLQIGQKLLESVLGVDARLEWVLPFLHELFGLAQDDLPENLDPKEKRQKTFEALRALCFAASQRRPHVLVVEDLQWIDRTSEDYLTFLIESLAAVPALIVTTHRPGHTVRWANQTYYTQIALDALSAGEVDVMMAKLLGTQRIPPDLLYQIHERSEGNPLFVEEIVKSLRERKLLVPNNGGYIWAKEVLVDFPVTVQDIIRARLDRLEEPVKRTLQAAAVIGREFGVNLLRHVCEAAHEVEQHLAMLTRLELVHETQFFPAPAYTFKHAVMQDVAYQSLLGNRRKKLHGAIGRALASLPDPDGTLAAQVARHAAQAGDSELCVRACVRGGERCLRLFAFAEAETMADLDRHHVGLLPREDRIKLHIALLKILVYPGVRLRKPEGLSSEIARLCGEAQEAGLIPELSDGMHLLTWIYHLSWGDFPRARANLVQMMEFVDRLPVSQNIEAIVSSARCMAVLEVHMPKARAMFEGLAAFGPAAVETLFFQWGLGLVKRWEGDIPGARKALTTGAQLARERGDPWAEFECMSALGAVELEADRPEAAAAICHDLKPLAAKLGEGGTEGPLVDALAALAAAARGEPSADEALEAAIRLLAKMDAKYILAYVLNAAAEIDAAEKQWDRARRRALDALEAANISSRAPEIVRARALLARVAAAQGDTQAAQQELALLQESDPEQLSARARAALDGIMAKYGIATAARR